MGEATRQPLPRLSYLLTKCQNMHTPAGHSADTRERALRGDHTHSALQAGLSVSYNLYGHDKPRA